MKALTEHQYNLIKDELPVKRGNEKISSQAVSKLFENCNQINSLDLAWHDYITPHTLNQLSHNSELKAIDLSG